MELKRKKEDLLKLIPHEEKSVELDVFVEKPKISDNSSSMKDVPYDMEDAFEQSLMLDLQDEHMKTETIDESSFTPDHLQQDELVIPEKKTKKRIKL